MNTANKIIKYFGYVIAISLIAGIFSAIAGIVTSGFFGFTSRADVPDEIIALKKDESKFVLDIAANYAKITVKEGDELGASSNDEKTKIEKKTNQLTVRGEEDKFWWDKEDSIEVTIPKGMNFDAVSIVVGAGEVNVDNVVTKYLTMDAGASKVAINNITTSDKTKINGGVGEFTIKNGSLNNLDLNLGIGSSSITAALFGNADIDSGIGETKLTLLGGKSIYSVSAKKGIGGINIDGASVGDDEKVGTGSNYVHVSGGIGSVNVSFDEVTVVEPITVEPVVVEPVELITE